MTPAVVRHGWMFLCLPLMALPLSVARAERAAPRSSCTAQTCFTKYQRMMGPLENRASQMDLCNAEARRFVNYARAQGVNGKNLMVVALERKYGGTLKVNRSAFNPWAFGQDRQGRPGHDKFNYHVFVVNRKTLRVFDPLLKNPKPIKLGRYLDLVTKGVPQDGDLELHAFEASHYVGAAEPHPFVQRGDGWNNAAEEWVKDMQHRRENEWAPFDEASQKRSAKEWWEAKPAPKAGRQK